eukprot:m.215122 g.215122  ORF g.215122 m.215122 type:complete len:180 (+) comp33184_c2_seq1:311-850(+)
MADSEKMTEPVMCVGGCGFYGNPTNGDLCSKCSRDTNNTNNNAPVQTKSQPGHQSIVEPTPAPAPTPSISDPTPTPPLSTTTATTTATITTTTTVTASSTPPIDNPTSTDTPKKKKARCFSCRKKTGMLGFTCRCGELFCASHRHADDHACAFDYKTMDRAKIERENQVIATDRVANRI